MIPALRAENSSGPGLTLASKVGYSFQAMKTKPRALLEYPDQTRGSKLAAEIRKKANGLTPKQRAEYFRKGMVLIYGGDGKKETSRG